jgi:predicted nuclease with RNAse H fold
MSTFVPSSMIVAGVDVGGRAKGFHAVALRDGAYVDKFASRTTSQVAEWCRQIGARVIGVDAPCRWSSTGRARTAERQLMAEKTWCFSTPSREIAEAHPKDHFGWMRNGEELFSILESTHTLFTGDPGQITLPLCFETFPNAIARALAGCSLPARNKRTDRRKLLKNAGIDISNLSNIDTVDAALCALTAHYLARDKFEKYGDVDTGFIVVPPCHASGRSSERC